jgi:hypothetical protein
MVVSVILVGWSPEAVVDRITLDQQRAAINVLQECTLENMRFK